MGNTPSQQSLNHNGLKRFNSPRSPGQKPQSIGRGTGPKASGDPAGAVRDQETKEKDDRVKRRGSTKDKDGKPHVHRSLRSKKKSLELPDLAPLSLNPYQPVSSTSGRPIPSSQLKTASIPIPGHQESYRHKSITAVDYYQPSFQPVQRDPASVQRACEQHNAQPVSEGLYPSPSSITHASITPTSTVPTPYASAGPSRESSRSPAPDTASEDEGPGDVTITADDDEHNTVVKSSQFNPLTVRSSIPLGIFQAEEEPLQSSNPLPLPSAEFIDPDKHQDTTDEEIMVKISWHGGGTDVYLARQGDEKYMNKLRMEREGSTSTFSTSLSLAPGTHHIRFFVDDQWRVADDLPATVDDLGGLANYVAVGPGFADKTLPSSPLPTSQPTSANTSTILTNAPKVGSGQKQETHHHTPPKAAITSGYSFWDRPDDSDSEEEPSRPAPINTSPPKVNGVPSRQITINNYIPQWTNEIPLELIEAAHEEEIYLAHREAEQASYFAHQSRYNRGPSRVAGFTPVPNIAPAPRLPRILEKLILNQQNVRPSVQAAAAGGAQLAGASLASPGGINNRLAGTSSQNREREGRDRVRSPIRDRERDRERPGGSDRKRERERDRRNLGMTSTPIEEKTEQESLDVTQERPLPVTTASGTNLTAQEVSKSGEREREREREGHPRENGRERHPPVDNRTIADDSSVLPVPSHAVIQHLTTSAIKNGVLGVGVTTRYCKKYMTTVYYKPT